MMAEGVLLVEQQGAVRLLTLNRPEKLNSFSADLLLALEEAVSAAQADDSVRAIIVTGAGGKAFASGNDISRLGQMDAMQAHADMVRGQQLLLRLHESPKPVIAMVNGYALGGGFELALACDFIVASTNAVFGFPEIRMATMPGWGGTQLAVLKLGVTRASEMVLSGQPYSVSECGHWGFINSICEPADLRAQTLAFASRFVESHPFAVRMSKRALLRANELSLAAGMDFEAASYAANFGTPHARAGLAEFLQRRAEKKGRSEEAAR